MCGGHGVGLIGVGSGENHRTGPVGEKLSDDLHAVLDRLPRRVDRLGAPRSKRTMVVDTRMTEVGEGQAAQRRRRVVGVQRARTDLLEQLE